VLATEIYDSAMVSLNWPRAAVQSILLVALLLLAMAGFGRVARSIERAAGFDATPSAWWRAA